MSLYEGFEDSLKEIIKQKKYCCYIALTLKCILIWKKWKFGNNGENAHHQGTKRRLDMSQDM